MYKIDKDHYGLCKTCRQGKIPIIMENEGEWTLVPHQNVVRGKDGKNVPIICPDRDIHLKYGRDEEIAEVLNDLSAPMADEPYKVIGW